MVIEEPIYGGLIEWFTSYQVVHELLLTMVHGKTSWTMSQIHRSPARRMIGGHPTMSGSHPTMFGDVYKAMEKAVMLRSSNNGGNLVDQQWDDGSLYTMTSPDDQQRER